jgi:hypothetical protein
LIKTENRYTLPINPPVGGKPVSDKSKTTIIPAMSGALLPRPFHLEISNEEVWLCMAIAIKNKPRFINRYGTA